jgi:hypothetical protein
LRDHLTSIKEARHFNPKSTSSRSKKHFPSIKKARHLDQASPQSQKAITSIKHHLNQKKHVISIKHHLNQKKHVISTEATDSLIVRRAVERSLYFALAAVCSCRHPENPGTLRTVHTAHTVPPGLSSRPGNQPNLPDP